MSDIYDELSICCVEFPAGDDHKDGTAAEGSQADTKGESTRVVKKLLLESMLKSVQAVLKQQQPGQNCSCGIHIYIYIYYFLRCLEFN